MYKRRAVKKKASWMRHSWTAIIVLLSLGILYNVIPSAAAAAVPVFVVVVDVGFTVERKFSHFFFYFYMWWWRGNGSLFVSSLYCKLKLLPRMERIVIQMAIYFRPASVVFHIPLIMQNCANLGVQEDVALDRSLDFHLVSLSFAWIH